MDHTGSKLDHNDLDQSSIDAFQKGDQKAFESLFRFHYRSLCYFAMQFIGDMPEAEDIVKECFVKLWNKHADFDHLKSIKSFLYIAARNACINHLNHLKVRNTFQKEFAYLEEARRDELILNQLIRAEFMQQIYQAIEELPAKRREVFKLAWFEGLKNDEIAQRLNISVFTVKAHKVAALNDLRMRFSNLQLMLFLLLCAQCVKTIQ